MQNSKIEWTEHTFNPWIGCTKVSPACAHCYAEGWAKRSGLVQWGAGAPRRRTAAWSGPVRWDRQSRIATDAWDRQKAQWQISDEEMVRRGFIKPRRPRVFACSLGDWLDDEVPIEWLADFLCLIQDTPGLDWLLLTKRPELWAARVSAAMVHLDSTVPRAGSIAEALANPAKFQRRQAALWIAGWIEAAYPDRGMGRIPQNIWVGTTVEDQQRANERIPALLAIPARVRFLSCEPLLGPVRLQMNAGHRFCKTCRGTGFYGDNFAGIQGNDEYTECDELIPRIDWVICGGESGGPQSRPMHPEWVRALRKQCEMAKVPFFFKQWGDWMPEREDDEFSMDGDFPNGATLPADWRQHPGEFVCLRPDGNRASGYGDTNAQFLMRVGKKAAGRILDGREWNESPTC